MSLTDRWVCDTQIELALSRDAHTGLANIYKDLGQPEESQKHRSLAGPKPKS